MAVLICTHPWSNGYDPGLPNRRRRFNSGRMLKNWKIMGIGAGNYFNILKFLNVERKEKKNMQKFAAVMSMAEKPG